MRYIKEDYLENIEQDDIVASEDSSKDLPEASYSSGFKYQINIYLIKRFSDILNTENDIQTFYENEFLRLYKYLRRNHFIENFSEIVFFHEDQEWRYPNDVYDLVRDIKDQYYLKFDYVGIKFFINIRFSPYTLLQFCASITKSIHFAVSLRIQTEEGKECQIGSLIPITSSFGKEEFRKM